MYGKIFFRYFFCISISGCAASLLLLGFCLAAAGGACCLAVVVASHCSGFSYYRIWGLHGTMASAAVAYGSFIVSLTFRVQVQ